MDFYRSLKRPINFSQFVFFYFPIMETVGNYFYRKGENMNGEIVKLIEGRVVSNLKKLDEEKSSYNRKMNVDETLKFIDKLQAEDKREDERIDKLENRKIQEIKIRDDIEDKAERRRIQEESQLPFWLNAGLEIGKVIFPVITFFSGKAIDYRNYDKIMTKSFKFEETGSISSYTSRKIQYPRFTK